MVDAFEVFHEPIALLGEDLRLVQANAAWCEAFGAGATGWGALAPAAVASAARRALAGGEPRVEATAPAPAPGGGAPDTVYRWTLQRLSGAGAAALMVHARPLSGPQAGEADARRRLEEELAEERQFFGQLIDSDPNLIFAKDAGGRFVLANRAMAGLLGTTVGALLGRREHELHGDAEVVERHLRAEQAVLSTGREETATERITRADGEQRWYLTTRKPVSRLSGEVQVVGFGLDITDRVEIEQVAAELEKIAARAQLEAQSKVELVEELDRRLATVEAQHREIIALSAPILEIGQGVIGVPIIGALDAQRAAALMERLLAAVAERQVVGVILDLTGAELVESATAAAIMQIVHAIQMLGARVVLSGVRPAVARTVVALGLDLSGVAVVKTPRDATLFLRRAL